MILYVIINVSGIEAGFVLLAQALQIFFSTASRSRGLSAVQIKMEGQEAGETITDIQNYLETFNKEIQGGDQIVQHVTGDYAFQLYSIIGADPSSCSPSLASHRGCLSSVTGWAML
jgi:hypothetical protein